MGNRNKSGVKGVANKCHGKGDYGERGQIGSVCVCVKTMKHWYKKLKIWQRSRFCPTASDSSVTHSTLECVLPNTQARDRCLWANVNFLLWIYCQRMMNALNIAGYSSHIFSEMLPLRHRVTEPPIGVVIAQPVLRSSRQREREREIVPLQTYCSKMWCNRAL